MARKSRRARKLRRTRKQRGGQVYRSIAEAQEMCDKCSKENEKSEECKIINCGKYCAVNRTNNNVKTGRCIKTDTAIKLNERPYLQGLSRIIVENGIEYVPPEGEISYGDTITTCTTVTIVFENNSKISLHYNPATYLADPNSTPLNIDSMFDKIKEKIRENKLERHPIKSIFILGSSSYYIDNDQLLNVNTLQVREPNKNKRNKRESLDHDNIKKLFENKLKDTGNTFLAEPLLVCFPGVVVESRAGNYVLIKSDGTLSGNVRANGYNVPLDGLF
jgi:hypothetical protein